MELPVDILAIIKEYACPITRSDWRTLHVMTDDRFIYCLLKDKDTWWKRNDIFNRVASNFKPILNDRIMRRYILRYQLWNYAI